jgi:molybdopterin converting factor small subunit
MSKATGKRFSYLPEATGTETPAVPVGETVSELQSVPKGQGRMEQAREQLNVRIPTQLKRRAVSKAVLEGKTIGELVEELLVQYVEK